MTTAKDIVSAIDRSISHTEIVRVEVADLETAYLDVVVECDDCDRATENDGSLDVWGDKDGRDFRIRLVRA